MSCIGRCEERTSTTGQALAGIGRGLVPVAAWRPCMHLQSLSWPPAHILSPVLHPNSGSRQRARASVFHCSYVYPTYGYIMSLNLQLIYPLHDVRKRWKYKLSRYFSASMCDSCGLSDLVLLDLYVICA